MSVTGLFPVHLQINAAGKGLRSKDPFHDRERIPIAMGVMILAGLAYARRVNEVPGAVIPGRLLRRLEEFEDPTDQAHAAVKIAVEQVRRAPSHVSGNS